MKVIIAGCRDCVDTMGEQWGRWHGLPVHEYPADWKTHGNAAGPLRNLAMLNHPADGLLAIWDGKSRGTANMIAIAKARGILLHVHMIKDC